MGKPLINSAYQGKSMDVLNRAISGRSDFGVSYYYDKAEGAYFYDYKALCNDV